MDRIQEILSLDLEIHGVNAPALEHHEGNPSSSRRGFGKSGRKLKYILLEKEKRKKKKGGGGGGVDINPQPK
jgi:hypothetical protein